jgi:hypothetical protein
MGEPNPRISIESGERVVDAESGAPAFHPQRDYIACINTGSAICAIGRDFSHRKEAISVNGMFSSIVLSPVRIIRAMSYSSP